MNYRLKGFSLSSIVHLAVLLAAVGLNGSIRHFSKPVVIDFSIEEPLPQAGARKAAGEKSRPAAQPRPEQAPSAAQAQKTAPVSPPAPQVAAISETISENRAPAAEVRSQDSGRSRDSSRTSNLGKPSGSGASDAGANSSKTGEPPSASHGHGGSPEAAKQEYLSRHFAYIRSIVQKNLSYPQIARKMGWQGKVIISFIVSLEGHARDITIKEGSGFGLLDKNAVAAVQNASPFPKPPIEAQLVIPVSYSLE